MGKTKFLKKKISPIRRKFFFKIKKASKPFLYKLFKFYLLKKNTKIYLPFLKNESTIKTKIKNTSPLLLKFFLSQFKPEENIFLKSSVTKFLFYKIFFFYKIFSSKTKSKIKKNTKTTQKKFKLKF